MRRQLKVMALGLVATGCSIQKTDTTDATQEGDNVADALCQSLLNGTGRACADPEGGRYFECRNGQVTSIGFCGWPTEECVQDGDTIACRNVVCADMPSGNGQGCSADRRSKTNCFNGVLLPWNDVCPAQKPWCFNTGAAGQATCMDETCAKIGGNGETCQNGDIYTCTDGAVTSVLECPGTSTCREAGDGATCRDDVCANLPNYYGEVCANNESIICEGWIVTSRIACGEQTCFLTPTSWAQCVDLACLSLGSGTGTTCYDGVATVCQDRQITWSGACEEACIVLSSDDAVCGDEECSDFAGGTGATCINAQTLLRCTSGQSEIVSCPSGSACQGTPGAAACTAPCSTGDCPTA